MNLVDAAGNPLRSLEYTYWSSSVSSVSSVFGLGEEIVVDDIIMKRKANNDIYYDESKKARARKKSPTKILTK